MRLKDKQPMQTGEKIQKKLANYPLISFFMTKKNGMSREKSTFRQQ